MSFILDALRKSEIERQRQSGPSIAEFPIARQDRRLPIALVVIGLLLAVNIAVVVYFMLRDTGSPAAVAASATPTAEPLPPPATSPAATPAAQPPPAAGSQLASQSLPAELELEPPAVYYDAPATEAPDPPDPTLLPEAVARPGVAYGDAPQGDDLPSVAAATGLPELSVDLHIFAADPAKRAVFINGRRYTQGARTAEGPVVEEITPEGAVLSYRGRRFQLPRL
jgi:general secretion pathway protein B